MKAVISGITQVGTELNGTIIPENELEADIITGLAWTTFREIGLLKCYVEYGYDIDLVCDNADMVMTLRSDSAEVTSRISLKTNRGSYFSHLIGQMKRSNFWKESTSA